MNSTDRQVLAHSNMSLRTRPRRNIIKPVLDYTAVKEEEWALRRALYASLRQTSAKHEKIKKKETSSKKRKAETETGDIYSDHDDHSGNGKRRTKKPFITRKSARRSGPDEVVESCGKVKNVSRSSFDGTGRLGRKDAKGKKQEKCVKMRTRSYLVKNDEESVPKKRNTFSNSATLNNLVWEEKPRIAKSKVNYKRPRSKGDKATESDNPESPETKKKIRKEKVEKLMLAQRKFASSQPCSPSSLLLKQISTPLSERPKTEDFIKFLCLRGTSALPKELEYLNNPCLPPSPLSSDDEEAHYPVSPFFRRQSSSTKSTPAKESPAKLESQGTSTSEESSSNVSHQAEPKNMIERHQYPKRSSTCITPKPKVLRSSFTPTQPDRVVQHVNSDTNTSNIYTKSEQSAPKTAFTRVYSQRTRYQRVLDNKITDTRVRQKTETDIVLETSVKARSKKNKAKQLSKESGTKASTSNRSNTHSHQASTFTKSLKVSPKLVKTFSKALHKKTPTRTDDSKGSPPKKKGSPKPKNTKASLKCSNGKLATDKHTQSGSVNSSPKDVNVKASPKSAKTKNSPESTIKKVKRLKFDELSSPVGDITTLPKTVDDNKTTESLDFNATNVGHGQTENSSGDLLASEECDVTVMDYEHIVVSVDDMNVRRIAVVKTDIDKQENVLHEDPLDEVCTRPTLRRCLEVDFNSDPKDHFQKSNSDCNVSCVYGELLPSIFSEEVAVKSKVHRQTTGDKAESEAKKMEGKNVSNKSGKLFSSKKPKSSHENRPKRHVSEFEGKIVVSVFSDETELSDDSYKGDSFTQSSKDRRRSLKMKSQACSKYEKGIPMGPTLKPMEQEFKDPIKFLKKIETTVESPGICVVVPPDGWRSSTLINEDIRFTTKMQYVHKMRLGFGPCTQKHAAMKKYLEEMSVKMESLPQIGSCEIDPLKISEAMQLFGGLQQVKNARKWLKLAEHLHIPKSAHGRVNKLQDIYLKYVLPYDSLTKEKKEELEKQVQQLYLENPKDVCSEETESKGKSTSLAQFHRMACGAEEMYADKGDTPSSLENKFWSIVGTGDRHVAAPYGEIDAILCGPAFQVSKTKSGWNLSNLPLSSGSALHALGSLAGITTPTVKFGSVFSTSGWTKKSEDLQLVEYLHAGASRIWYAVPASSEKDFLAILTAEAAKREGSKDDIGKKCLMSPLELLEKGIPVSRVVQNEGQFILVMPNVYHCVVNTGYCCAEAVNFAPLSWILTHEKSSIFPVDKLLLCIVKEETEKAKISDHAEQLLKKFEKLRVEFAEITKSMNEAGIKSGESQDVLASMQGMKQRKNVMDWQECSICSKPCYLTLVNFGSSTRVLCPDHAIKEAQSNSKALADMESFTQYSEAEWKQLETKLRQKIVDSLAFEQDNDGSS